MQTVVDYTVSGVTVYPDRARVSCRGVAALTTGAQQLVFDALPLALEQESVRVGGSGTAQVRIMGVDVPRRYYAETPQEGVRSLEKQIEALAAERRVLEDDLESWQAQAEHLAGLRSATEQYAKGLARGKTTVEDQARLLSFLKEQDAQVRSGLRELELKIEELDRELEKLQGELDGLRSIRPRQRYQAVVDVEVLSEGEFAAELRYVVRRAGWQPLYDLRLIEEDGQHVLQLSTFARVTQQTGQHWEAVQLSVSTARPALNQRLPELRPWFVDVEPPLQPRVRPALAMSKEAVYTMAAAPPEVDALREEAPAIADAETAVAEVDDSGMAVVFNISGYTDIPSDGSPHNTLIHQFGLPTKLDYLAIPRHTTAVYRRAAVRNTTGGPLLGGQANLFVEEDFIGKTELEYTPTNGEIELLLGVEERVTVEREMTRRDVDKRLLRDLRLLRYGYKIDLQNLLAAPSLVTVQDQIPVSRHEQVKIQLHEVHPPLKEQSDLNIIEWQVELQPESEQTISYEYTVEHPRNVTVYGLRD